MTEWGRVTHPTISHNITDLGCLLIGFNDLIISGLDKVRVQTHGQGHLSVPTGHICKYITNIGQLDFLI